MQKQSGKSVFLQEIKEQPSLLWVMVGSFFIMGLGQLYNKQRLKALIFFALPLLFVALELGTGSWGKMKESYKSDYIQYFGEVLTASVQGQSDSLSLALNKVVTITAPSVEQIDASEIAADQDPGIIQIRNNFSADPAGTHGYIVQDWVSLALATAKADVEAVEVDPAVIKTVTDVMPLLSTAVAASVLELSGQAMPSGAFTGVWSADNAIEVPAGKLIRVTYPLNIDDTDIGPIIEYFTPEYAQQIVSGTPLVKEKHYYIRDNGGYITRGLWGMVTLGSLVIGDTYRGMSVEAMNTDKPWASADNSSLLLARGLIVVIMCILLFFFWALNIFDAWRSRKQFLTTGKTQNIRQSISELWEHAYVWVLIAPSILLILFFTVIPFFYTFLCSFTNWTYKVYLIQQLIKWNGIKEYLMVFGEPAWLKVFFQVFGWTIIWAVVSSITVYAMGFAHALVLESPVVRLKKVWRSVMIIPWAFPAMVSLLFFRNVFDVRGPLNAFLLQFNLMKPFSAFLYNIHLAGSAVAGKADDLIYWFDPSYNGNLAKAVALLVNLWLGAPYFMMLITGIMTTIPAERYEAAMIDGASSYQRFRFITLPMVLNATIPAMIMTVTFNFNNFGALYFLTGGGPNWLIENLPESLRTWMNSMPGQTDILISWIYKISFNMNAQLYNKAAVYTLFVFLILGTFSLINMKLTKAFNEEGEE